MKKHTLIVHSAWALTAAAAWWAGSRHGMPDDSSSQVPGRSRLTATGVPSGHNDRRPDETAPSSSGGAAETLAWLRPRLGADGRLSPENMATAVAEAMHDPDPVRGLRHFTQLLENLTPENAVAALQLLRAESGGKGPSPWLSMLCSAWGAQDGVAAMASLSGRRERGAAITGWAGRDAAAAEQWLATLPKDTSDEERRALQYGFVRGLSRRDASAALEYVAGRSEGDRADLARVLAGEQLTRGTRAAAGWAMELKDTAMRGSALESVARHFMQVDPPGGASWASESSLAPDMRQAVARVADWMAGNDVQAALAWTRQLPRSPGQEEAFQQVFSQWARTDPTASSQELVRMSPGWERDNAIHSFSRVLVNENPEDAMTWAASITEPSMRLDTQIDVARQWYAAAPAAAQPWIVAHLPVDAQARALK